MTEVKFTKAIGGHTIGATINTSPGAAAYLVETGVAEPVKTEKPAPKSPAARGKAVGGASPSVSPITAG